MIPPTWYEDTALQLAGENGDLRAGNANLQADVLVYREIARAAIHQLHALTVARERDQAKYLRLLAELRQFRGDERRAA